MTQNMFQVSSASVSDKGLSEKRPQNEDSFLSLPESGLYAVADGVGGAQAGDVASEMAVEILGEAFINLRQDGDAEDRMRDAIEKANSAIYQMSHELAQLRTMATTLVAVHINENIATIGHVGDSRLYRLDENGVLYRETQDHSVVEEEVRAGRMTREQAETHPSRNVISRALGAESFVEIDMKTIMFEPNTTFLLCSDGITRHVPDEELRDLLYMEDDVQKVCDILKARCYDRGAEDNLTAVVMKVGVTAETMDMEAPELEFGDEPETVAAARAGTAETSELFSERTTSELVVGGESDSDFELDIDTDSEPSLHETADRVSESVGIEETEVIDDIDDAVDMDDIDELDDADDIVIPTREPVLTAAAGSNLSTDYESEMDLAAVKDVRAYRVDESTGSGLMTKIVTGLIWLLIGAVIGALGYSFFIDQRSAGDLPVDSVEVANTTVLSFEQRRRQTDLDPAKYLSTYSTVADKTAADHYLVGRAYLLQKNYGAAKSSFENAEKSVNSEDISNRPVLESDIAAGLTIASSVEAQKEFESFQSGEPAPAESNSNGAANK